MQSISVTGFTQKSIIKQLNKYCDAKRIRRNGTEAKIIDEQMGASAVDGMDGYIEAPKIYVERCRDQITIYRLKPENQIPDFYNIIRYKEYQADHLDA